MPIRLNVASVSIFWSTSKFLLSCIHFYHPLHLRPLARQTPRCLTPKALILNFDCLMILSFYYLKHKFLHVAVCYCKKTVMIKYSLFELNFYWYPPLNWSEQVYFSSQVLQCPKTISHSRYCWDGQKNFADLAADYYVGVIDYQLCH